LSVGLSDNTAVMVSRLRISLPRTVHVATAVPNFYAGIAAGGEQPVSPGPRFAVGPTRNHLKLCYTVG
jgi:hypothetical protein